MTKSSPMSRPEPAAPSGAPPAFQRRSRRAAKPAASAPAATPQASPQAAHAAQPPARLQSPPSSLTSARTPALASGWHELTDEAYHADPCPSPSLSSHIAMLVIQQSLQHAWRAHPKSPLFEESVLGSAADRGSAAHALLFGGRTIEPIQAEDYRTAAAREERDQARASGRIPILARELEALGHMIEPARQRFHDLYGGAFLCEQSAIWRIGEGGWRRARIDTLSPDRALIIDYKTTEAAVDAHSCERRIADMGVQIQAAAYVEAVETLHPDLMGRVRFLYQWQEAMPPYALSPPIEMSEAFMALGRAQWQAAGSLWDKALCHQAFPGYSAQRFLACPPPWELSRWEERTMIEGLASGASA